MNNNNYPACMKNHVPDFFIIMGILQRKYKVGWKEGIPNTQKESMQPNQQTNFPTEPMKNTHIPNERRCIYEI